MSFISGFILCSASVYGLSERIETYSRGYSAQSERDTEKKSITEKGGYNINIYYYTKYLCSTFITILCNVLYFL